MSVQNRRVMWLIVLILTVAFAPSVFVSIYSKEDKRPSEGLSRQILDRSAEAPGEPSRITQSPPSERGRGPSQMVNITLYEQGIYPQVIRVRPGRVIFSIDDKSRQASGIIIKAMGREQRIDKSVEALRGKGVVEVDVGRHEISDASRPENRSVLIVEP